jgi:hypothetical protein
MFASRNRSDKPFNLNELWKLEWPDVAFSQLAISLMTLMNELIKQYSLSDDYGEYSKKPELWKVISSSPEIQNFIRQEQFLKFMNRFCIKKGEPQKSRGKTDIKREVDFSLLYNMVSVVSKTSSFYKKILFAFEANLKPGEIYKLEQVIATIDAKEEIQVQHLAFIDSLLDKIRINNPEFFDTWTGTDDQSLKNALDFVVLKYNNAIEECNDIAFAFAAIRQLASANGANHSSAYDEIGRLLERGQAPTIRLLYLAAFYTDMVR